MAGSKLDATFRNALSLAGLTIGLAPIAYSQAPVEADGLRGSQGPAISRANTSSVSTQHSVPVFLAGFGAAREFPALESLDIEGGLARALIDRGYRAIILEGSVTGSWYTASGRGRLLRVAPSATEIRFGENTNVIDLGTSGLSQDIVDRMEYESPRIQMKAFTIKLRGTPSNSTSNQPGSPNQSPRDVLSISMEGERDGSPNSAGKVASEIVRVIANMENLNPLDDDGERSQWIRAFNESAMALSQSEFASDEVKQAIAELENLLNETHQAGDGAAFLRATQIASRQLLELEDVLAEAARSEAKVESPGEDRKEPANKQSDPSSSKAATAKNASEVDPVAEAKPERNPIRAGIAWVVLGGIPAFFGLRFLFKALRGRFGSRQSNGNAGSSESPDPIVAAPDPSPTDDGTQGGSAQP